MLSNVCKHNVTRFPYEISRLAQDIAGGVVVTLPSEQDFNHEIAGPILKKYLKGKDDIPVEHRQRMLRLIENMTLGRNAVGYLTESLHGAGVAAGAAHPDRAADGYRGQETVREGPGGDRAGLTRP